MRFCEVLVLAHKHNCGDPKLLGLVLLEPLANNFGLSDVRTGGVGQGVGTNEDIDAALSSSSRARSSSSSVRGAAMALPVQFEISAVRRLFASPRGRKSLMVADVMRALQA